jgi:hypothetical protein
MNQSLSKEKDSSLVYEAIPQCLIPLVREMTRLGCLVRDPLYRPRTHVVGNGDSQGGKTATIREVPKLPTSTELVGPPRYSHHARVRPPTNFAVLKQEAREVAFGLARPGSRKQQTSQ